MTVDILLKYQNFPPLEIELDDSALKSNYKDLVRKNNLEHQVISRDPCKYNLAYFAVLAQQANNILGWDWAQDRYTPNDLVRLHKDIEQYLANGFENIPQEHDNLLHELHYALHAIQGNSSRGNWIQVEWFSSDGITVPADLKFTTQLKFGDVKLQNPYVGHDPIFVYRQQDFYNISQTCKFHDLVRPGINIMIKPDYFEITDHYKSWYNTHAPHWVQENSWDKVLRFTGWPVVGRVKNLDVLQQIATSPVFEIEFVEVL
jgi:hypothetical protein